MQKTRLLLVCACVVVAHPIRAQVTADSTTAMFHAGEWGIGLNPATYLAEAGVLRFATSARAWVLDGSAGFDRQVLSGAGTFGTDVSGQSISVNVLFGPRWYDAMSAHVVHFVGAGISGGYARANAAQSSDLQKFWSAGAYGEFGMQYLFTRNVALGWRGTIVASRTESRATSGSGSNTIPPMTYYHIGLAPVQVLGAIYF